MMNTKEKRRFCGLGWLAACCLVVVLAVGAMHFLRKTDYSSGLRVVAIFGSEDISFWEEVRQGLRRQAEEQGVVLTEYTPEDESLFPSLIESTYYTDVDAVAICIYESDMWKECQPILKNMREKGIKVIVADTPPEIEDYDAYIGLDNYAIGQEMAENVYQNYEEGQRILVRYPGKENLVLDRRNRGFCDRLTELGLEDAIEYISMSTSTIEGITELKERMQQLDGSVVVAAFTTNATIDMAEIIHSEGLDEKVRLIGFGESDEAASYVDKGMVDVFYVQDNQGIGSQVIQAAEDLCSGRVNEKKKWDVDVLVYSGDEETK